MTKPFSWKLCCIAIELMWLQNTNIKAQIEHFLSNTERHVNSWWLLLEFLNFFSFLYSIPLELHDPQMPHRVGQNQRGYPPHPSLWKAQWVLGWAPSLPLAAVGCKVWRQDSAKWRILIWMNLNECCGLQWACRHQYFTDMHIIKTLWDCSICLTYITQLTCCFTLAENKVLALSDNVI